MRLLGGAVNTDLDFFEQCAQQLFAVAVGGRRRRPDTAGIVGEREDRLFLVRCKGFRSLHFAAGEFGFSIGDRLQSDVPFGFQPAGHQAVVRIDSTVTAFGFQRDVAGLFDLASVLVQGGVVAGLELVSGGESGLHRCRCHRGQERLGDGGVDGLPADVHMPRPTALDQLG